MNRTRHGRITATTLHTSDLKVDTVRSANLHLQGEGNEDIISSRDDLGINHLPAVECFCHLGDRVEEIDGQCGHSINGWGNQLRGRLTERDDTVFNAHNSSFSVGDGSPTTGHSQACSDPTEKDSRDGVELLHGVLTGLIQTALTVSSAVLFALALQWWWIA